jgi:tripartite-type tricarboxylate transporter receptor subunit TctC
MIVLGAEVVLAAETKTVADFFKGATIRIIVFASPGGAADTCARVPALSFGRYTGARVIVENMAGAGGYVGLRYLYTAKPDGLTLGLMPNPTGAFMAEELGQKEITWQLDKFEYIARVLRGSGGILMVGKQSSIRTLEDLLKSKREIRAATMDPTVGTSLNSALAAEALGLNLKIVTGFPGGRACIMAVLKGEIEMTVNPPAGFEDEFKKGELRAIAIAAGREIAPIFRPIFASVPRLLDLPLPQEKKRYLELSASLNEIGFPLSGPPNVPKERVQFLERAWLKALGEPEVKKTLETRGDFYAPLTGAEYLQILKGLKKVVADIGAKNVNHILFEKYY